MGNLLRPRLELAEVTLSTRARSLVGSGGSPWRAPGPPAAYLRFRGPAVVSAGTPGNSPFSFSSSLRIRTEASTAARPWGDGGGDTEGARRPRGVCVGGWGTFLPLVLPPLGPLPAAHPARPPVLPGALSGCASQAAFHPWCAGRRAPGGPGTEQSRTA